jgi:hypothetical protein
MIRRRSFLIGLGALVAAPAIVRAGALMPIRGMVLLTRDTTFYVSPDGSDLNNGLSSVAPFRTVQHLLDRLDLNEHTVTFQYLNGIYYENVDCPRTGDVTFAADNAQTVLMANNTIVSHNKHAPVISATNYANLDIQYTTFIKHRWFR